MGNAGRAINHTRLWALRVAQKELIVEERVILPVSQNTLLKVTYKIIGK